MKLHDSKVLSGKQVISILTILGICALGLVFAFDRELPLQDQKSVSEVVESAEIGPRMRNDRAEISTSLEPTENADLEFVDSTTPSEEASSKSLFGEFFSLVDSFDLDFKSEFNDYVFNSDAIEYYEDNFAEIFRHKPRARSDIIEKSTLSLLDSLWGEPLSKINLTDRELRSIRSTIHRIYIQNAEFSDLRNSGELTVQEWSDKYADHEEILEMLSRLIPDDKVQELKGHYEEKVNNQEPNLLREAMIRDSINFPAFDAIHFKDPVRLESLLAAGADINAVSEFTPDISLFQRAVDSEIPTMIEVMLAYGADINSKDVYGNSMLHRAVRAGNVEIVNQLIESGADPLARDTNGLTPAMRARLSRLDHGEEKYNELSIMLKNAEINASR
jgi:ankyrin repeat protein